MKLFFRKPPTQEQHEPEFSKDWTVKQGTLPIEVKRNAKAPKLTQVSVENFAGVLFEQKLKWL